MLYPTVYDTFGRATSSGWGTSDSGHAWTVSVSGDSSTTPAGSSSPGYGVHAVSATGTARYSTVGPNVADCDIRFQVGVSALALTQPISTGAVARWTNASNHYYFRVDFNTDQVIGYKLNKVVAGVDTNLAAGLVTGIKQVTNGRYWVRVKLTGTSLQLKVWSDATGEPPGWTATWTDAAISAAGQVGVRSILNTGNTNTTPVTFTYSYFTCGPYVYRDGKPLQVNIEAAFGANLSADPATWQWVDITSKVAHEKGIRFREGRTDGQTQAEPATVDMEVFNATGDFSEDNPLSQYYPNVRANVPLRVRVMVSHVRGSGYANGWIPSWDTSGKRAVAKVTAAGIGRRLKQGKTPLRSAIYRAQYFKNAVGQWPCEDGQSATQAASAKAGGQAMVVAGIYPVRFGQFSSTLTPPGSGPLPDLSGGGSLVADVPVTTITDSWTVECAFATGVNAGASLNILQWFTIDASGNRVFWALSLAINTPTTPTLELYPDDHGFYIDNGALASFAAATSAIPVLNDGNVRHVRLTASQSGSNKTLTLYVDDVQKVTCTYSSGTWHLGRVERILLNGYLTGLFPDQGGWPGSLTTGGHVGVWNSVITASGTIGDGDHGNALKGYPGEQAGARISRLCTEQAVPVYVTGTSSSPVGAQPQSAFYSALQDCEAADGGVLYDGAGFGINYITRASRYNQNSAAITLDRTSSQIAPPFEPDPNPDQRVRNDVTVSRTGGSSARFIESSAADPKSTVNIGVYDEQVTVNLATDDVLADHASWRVHLGTVQGYRFPAVNLNLAHRTAGPALAISWLGAALTGRVDITNLPIQAGYNPLRSIIEGYSAVIDFFTWDIGLVLSPYDPWRISTVEDGTEPWRVDTDGSTLSASVTSSATSLSAATTANLWTTTATFPADLPFDIEIEGERITVTVISGTSSPQTFTVTRSVNGVVKAHPSGASVKLWRPNALAL